MRWLAITLAAAATATAAPAAAQSYGYGYSQPYQGSDFDWRRCHQNESAAACRNRLQQRRDTRYGDYRYDYSRDYPRDSVNSGYGSVYEYYADSARYGERYPYYGGSSGYYGNGGYGGSSGYYGGSQGYYGGSSGYYGYPYGQGGYYGGGSYSGYDSGAALALTVLGVALGAQILGSLDDRDYYERNRHDRSWRDWCRDRYNTFDWSSGTYMGNDGYRRYCRRN